MPQTVALAQRRLQLVPLADMCNHSPDCAADSEPLSVMACGTVLLCAGTDMAAGEEVTFSYRPAAEGNGALLLDYGFAQLSSGAFVGCDALRQDPELCKSWPDSGRI